MSAASQQAKTCLIPVGNPGSGKSFLMNLLAGENRFVHQVAAASVTKDIQSIVIYPTFADPKKTDLMKTQPLVVYDIPGLIESDEKRVEQNKKLLIQAIESFPLAMFIFIFNHQNGRLIPQDIELFRAVTIAYSIQPQSTIIVFNQACIQMPNWRQDTVILFQQLTGWPLEELNLLFVPDLPVTKDAQIDFKNQSVKLAAQQLLLSINFCIPGVCTKSQDILFKKDEIQKHHTQLEQLKKQMSMEANKFQALREKLAQQLK
jgi:hypothetical protein